ncbi:MAG TPA: PKD domain-containing protein [Candidatus Saccharimonadales bacterium]|nr:PKD domain-containing protein [Candidatus Saccharimonadales bacterium]
MAVLRRLGQVSSKKVSFIAGLAMALVALAGVAYLSLGRAGAATCDNNNIIQCGFSSKSEFINMVQSNNDGHGHHDLQAIYAHYGFTSADYTNFINHALPGEAMRDGRIVVNGKVVGTASRSVGRQKLESSDTAVPIGGTTYFENTLDQRFASGVSQLAVFVLFDSSGTPEFTVMPSCGNEVTPVPAKSSAACQMLNKTAVAGKANTFNFTASATHVGNATITKFVYDFGDGSPTVTQTSGSTVVTHTYTKTGTFTAKVTVFASVPGNDNLQLPVIADCTKQVTIAAPPAVAVSCVQLMAVMVDDNKMAFTFTATAQMSGGAKLTSGDFDFGDGTPAQTGVQPASTTTVTTNHTYATAGTFTASATLHFLGNDGKPVTAPACTTSVTPQAPTPPTPTPTPTPTPPTPTPPVTPPVPLPNTGAGNVVALFAGTSIVGTLGYHQLLRRRKLSRE